MAMLAHALLAVTAVTAVTAPKAHASLPDSQVEDFGADRPLGRAAEPDDAPSFVFFASNRLSSYYSGEVLAPTGGETLPG